MIRGDFPYLRAHFAPVPETVGCPILAACGRAISGVSMQDETFGDASDGPAWFARIDTPGGTLVELTHAARECGACLSEALARAGATDARHPDAAPIWPAHFWNPAAFHVPNARPWGGIIYGQDSDGFEIVGAFRARHPNGGPDAIAAPWNRLAGVWGGPVRDYAYRLAENESRYRVPFGRGFRIEPAEGFRTTRLAFRLVHDSGADLLIQSDRDRVPVAECFGYVRRGFYACDCSRHWDDSADCPECGKPWADFTEEADAYISELCGTGIRATDPGYFDDGGRP